MPWSLPLFAALALAIAVIVAIAPARAPFPKVMEQSLSGTMR